jgi:hypothetical protein
MPATKARNIRQFNVAWIRHRAASLALERSALLIVLVLVLELVLDVFKSTGRYQPVGPIDCG